MADGPARFTQGSTCPALLRVPARRTETSGTGLSPSVDRLSRLFPSNPSHHDAGPTTPDPQTRVRFGLCPVRSPLLGVSGLFSLPPGTKMFQFPGFASTHASGCTASGRAGCPIRTSADQRSLAPTRGFSQLATSFIAFRSLGIRHAPFLSFAAVIAGPCPAHGTDLNGGAPCGGRHLVLCDLWSSCHDVSFNARHSDSESERSVFSLVPACQIAMPTNVDGVENNGFEPLTPCLQSRCSSQLS